MDFVSGELQPQFRIEIEEHMGVCPSCAAFVHSYRVTITLTRHLPALPLRDDFARRLENLLKQAGNAGE
jgi:anti-sigma factor RsiW